MMRTTRPKTPIEAAIDCHFGVVNTEAQIFVMLRCPKCDRTQRAPADETDPEGTATIRVICPKCDDGDFHEPHYFDANGMELALDPG